jgi:hypothetical protein
MANGLLAKNGLIVTGSVEVQNAVTASTFSGDGSGLSGVSDFPYTGSAVISGSLEIIGNTNFTGSINFLNNSTNRIYFENAASITQPQIRLRTHNTGITMRGNDVLALMSNGSGMIGIKKTAATSINFPSAAKVGFTTNTSVEAYNPETYFRRYSSGVIGIGYGAVTSANLSGSLILTNITASGHVSASTYYGDGSNLTGIETDPFPYTGSAVISGSLDVKGGITITGSNALSSEYSLAIGNPSSNNLLLLTNAGKLSVGRDPFFYMPNGSISAYGIFYSGTGGNTTQPAFYIGSGQGGAGRGFYGTGQGIGVSVNNAASYGFKGSNSTNVNQPSSFGIGMDTPSALLDIKYANTAGGAQGRNLVRISGSADATHAEAFLISNSGNTGIGTWSPNYKLEVVGEVSASTYYGDGSNLTGIQDNINFFTMFMA